MNAARLSDGDLVARLRMLVRREREVLADVLAHLGEVEARQLHLPAACSSMHVYCVRVLGMSEDEAFKRLQAARAARRFPVVGAAVAAGRLHLSGVVMVAPHLTDENAQELVAEVSGKSKAEIAVVLARRAPRPDAPTKIERANPQPSLSGQAEVVPEPVIDRGRVEPLAPERYVLQVTIDEATREKLERAQALMRHQIPSGDVAQVIDRALDALLQGIERRRFGAAKTPRPAKKSASPRYVSREVRRDVVARDGERCSFVGDDGRRCDATGFLEMDHTVPVAHGGDSSTGVRILCRAHNQYEARRLLGTERVERAKAAALLERDVLSGLRGIGVSAADARRAVAESRGQGHTIEDGLRAALRVLNTMYAGRRGGAMRVEASGSVA
jgi:hypothetical protein